VKAEASGSFFEKKEPKKLLRLASRELGTPLAKTNKSFCRAFFKKRVLS
jgi:hypothetical protein